MNINKTIKELHNRLDVVHPYSASSVNHLNKYDGINYWKGRKIISTKDWNDLYEKSSTYTDTYKTLLTSRRLLQYFPDNYNGSISATGIVEDDKLKEDIQKWNTDYYELLEFRKNPTLGRMKCSKCLLSGSNDDPIFIGIEKVFSRIVMKHCNNNNSVNDYSHSLNITYHCNVMNIFSCPFVSIKSYNENEEIESKYPYKREDLFSLHQISFAIEQAITTFSEITKDNEIIYEVDFKNDRVHEIHTKYNGEPESWGWHENVNEQLSKVKPISNILIRDEQDIYNILTNREKLEYLIEEYEKQQLDKELEEGSENEINNENLKSELKIQMKEEFKKYNKEQLTLLKENKQHIVDFIIDNRDSIRIEDLKTYEPIYKCYRKKGNCLYCKTISNIICRNSSNYNYNNNKDFWLCTNHWQQHSIGNH
jgi:hypothetical protein